MFDAIVLNVLRKCNGCKAGLSVMVEGVGGAGWLCPCSRDSSPRKFYSSSSAHEAVSCHVGGQPTVINHYIRGHVGMVEFQSWVDRHYYSRILGMDNAAVLRCYFE
jgi:hypothetical protein